MIMKKILGIVFLSFLFLVNANSAATQLKSGSFHEGEFKWKHKKMPLPPGKWETIEKWDWSIGFWTSTSADLVTYSGNDIDSLFGFGDIEFKGRYQGYIAPQIDELLYQGEHDGCYERPEYTLLKLFKKGKVHNCFRVRHIDVDKELNRPDDAKNKWASAVFRKWLRERNMNTPKILLCATGIYYAPVVRDTYYRWGYCINPEKFGASRNEFFTEDSSEYHPANINNYPDKKEFMDEWIVKTTQMHQQFELIFKAKEHHKLDFTQIAKKPKDKKIKKKQPKKTEPAEPIPDDNIIVAAASGTGFFVSDKGLIVTNHHVIDQCEITKVNFKGEEIEAKTLAIDKTNDLAIIKAEINPDKFYSVSNEDVTLLQDIIVAGFPLGKKVSAAIKTHKGSVTALAGYGDNYSNFQTDATINQGNSGGPIIDQKGNIVGIAVALMSADAGQNIFFAVKSSTLKTFASSNGINFTKPSNTEKTNAELGKLITEGTVFLECWMTVAKIKKLIAKEENKKAFYNKYQ